MVDLGTLGGNDAVALAINDSGQIVGHSNTAGNAAVHAFSWTPTGGMVDLGSLGGTLSVALGVNAAGQVIGYSTTVGNAAVHAFSWTPAGGMIDLGTLGGTDSTAIDINASGQVLGYSSTAGDAASHPFVWTASGGMVDLGTLGGQYAWPFGGINAAGQVVGYSNTAGNAAVHAFSWTRSGGMIDLNAHIPFAPPGMELFFGLAISDNGTIAAYANTGTVLLGGGSPAPVVGPIAASDPVAAGVQLSLSARFTDVNTTDTHTARWTWGDGSSESGIVSESGGSGTATGTHVFSAAGIYTVTLLVTDSTGRTAQVSRDIVVYDASAGFVTGEGWINSPAGAYKANPSLVGRATFGFVSKYQKGAKVPSGHTEFQFRAAKLNFHSDSYDWLVVAGARAQYKGSGTINGASGFKFKLTAIDGKFNGGGGVDRFRIRIWHYDAALQADVVDYDNQLDPSSDGTLAEGTAIGAGSIVIHK
jgi:probable HAF family extracellular repeat protein